MPMNEYTLEKTNIKRGLTHVEARRISQLVRNFHFLSKNSNFFSFFSLFFSL